MLIKKLLTIDFKKMKLYCVNELKNLKKLD